MNRSKREPRMRDSPLSPLRYPPINSRLRELIIETRGSVEPFDEPYTDEMLDDLHATFLKHEIKLLEEAGLARDAIPEHVETSLSIAAWHQVDFYVKWLESQTPKKMGAPPIDPTVKLFVVFYYLVAKGSFGERTHHAICQHVAEALGPGIRDDHISRVIKSPGRTIPPLSDEELPEDPIERGFAKVARAAFLQLWEKTRPIALADLSNGKSKKSGAITANKRPSGSERIQRKGHS